MSCGKGAYVECNCPNRRPVSGKTRWGRYGPWECGHESGFLVNTGWKDLVDIGLKVVAVLSKRQLGGFRVFRKALGITSPGYVHDTVDLTVSEAEAWLDEFELVRGIMRGEYFHDQRTTEQLHEVLREPVVRAYGFVDNRLVPWPGRPFSEVEIEEALQLGERICWASIESGNPIRLEC